MIQEKERRTASGLLMLTIFLTILVVAALGLFRAIRVRGRGSEWWPSWSSWSSSSS